MAKNTGNGSRIGSVKAREQSYNHKTGNWTKHGADGKFMSSKVDGTPYKGVAKHVDGRRNSCN